MDLFLESTFRAEHDHFWFRGLVRFTEPLIRESVAGISHPRILDCGCGTGANLKRLSRFGCAMGLDLSLGGLGFARSYEQTRIAQATITRIPFGDRCFDLVTAFDVLACLDEDDEREALAEMRRVLRPGGALLVNTAALAFLKGQHAVFGHEVRRATRSSFRRAIETAGFRISRLTYTNFSLMPLVVPVRMFQRLVGLSTPEESGADIIIPPAPVNAALSALLAVESNALRAVDMPIGSSLLALARRPA
jgi:ubiquinone/menaquinone biosynthesis C-methylase UbiE